MELKKNDFLAGQVSFDSDPMRCQVDGNAPLGGSIVAGGNDHKTPTGSASATFPSASATASASPFTSEQIACVCEALQQVDPFLGQPPVLNVSYSKHVEIKTSPSSPMSIENCPWQLQKKNENTNNRVSCGGT